MRRFPALLSGLLLLASAASAQIPAAPISSRSSPALIKYGKWGLLAASVTMNILARQAHKDADDAFQVITDACFADRTRCATSSNGHYADPLLESQFQRTLQRDRAARSWLIAGESALAGAAVGFIWELARRGSHPKNIPFDPEVGSRNGSTTVGFRVAF
jgi:hypothetical protein